ncbi:helix-turn-helix domain-containing protein [Arsenophonus apicola]|uniref:helix-turn-helix domain-containing protein n=1 Tax=Arsenophonus apicola TaxID=2879119 RepID=UPI0038797AA9
MAIKNDRLTAFTVPLLPKPQDLKEARALLTDPDITVEDVARRLGVGSSTLYRYLPAARHEAQEGEVLNVLKL